MPGNNRPTLLPDCYLVTTCINQVTIFSTKFGNCINMYQIVSTCIKLYHHGAALLRPLPTVERLSKWIPINLCHQTCVSLFVIPPQEMPEKQLVADNIQCPDLRVHQHGANPRNASEKEPVIRDTTQFPSSQLGSDSGRELSFPTRPTPPVPDSQEPSFPNREWRFSSGDTHHSGSVSYEEAQDQFATQYIYENRTATPTGNANNLAEREGENSRALPDVTTVSPSHQTQQNTSFSDTDSDSSPDFVVFSDQNNTLSSADNEVNISDVVEEELNGLVSETVMARRNSSEEASLTLVEDHVSRLFHNEDQASDEDLSDDENPSDANETTHTGTTPRRGEFAGGLRGWQYDSAFKEFRVEIDDVDNFLQRRYLNETRTVYRRAMMETRKVSCSDDIMQSQLTPLQCFRVFVPTSLLQKIADNVNRVLHHRELRPTDVKELEKVIIMHTLCAAYGEPVKAITEDPQSFLPFPVKARRYHEVWTSMSCTLGKRQRAEFEDPEKWNYLSEDSNSFITQIEADVASINRRICYVPGTSIFSLDDDLLRLSSRDVLALTALSQSNNPKKGLGIVNNALCSALTSLFLVSHHSRPGESLIDIWSHILQLLQGVPTTGSLKEMSDAIFASDRGYNGSSIMELINERLGATSLGTHKRSLDYPFVFVV